MTTPKTFIDIHVLQTVPPSCINRDETGSPKTALFGGVRRHRVSSQAWKRATRAEFNQHLNTEELGERTVHIIERITNRITELSPDTETAQAQGAAQKILEAAGIKVKAELADKADKDSAGYKTGYLLFVSRAQINALATLALEFIAENKVDKKAAKQALTDENSIDVALFGRMVADAPDLNVDAACQVSHALSVHKAQTEFDYFTAVDDNAPEDNAGATMIGTVEFVSSTLYRYATINAEQLLHNLASPEATIRAIEAFIKAFITSMPTGKQNTFASRTRPGVVLVEVREDQPVNLSGAFEKPIERDGGILAAAAGSMATFAIAEDNAFGTSPIESALLIADTDAREHLYPLSERASEVDLAGLIDTTVKVLERRLKVA